MEKNVRAASSSSKTSVTENKGKQDVPAKFPRLARYKESTSPHPECRRKPAAQKSKDFFDKRPRNRNGFISERYRSEVVHVADSVGFEEAYGHKQGCKKVSLNHLLNFTLTPVESGNFIPGRSHARFKLPKYNKEQFLQANCQFVTREGEDYAVHYRNPDILVDWSFIEEVRLRSNEIPSCPICLYPPVAAKITRCGHIYCWPCILHYLALTDKTWQKCPICFDAVHKVDLKSVLPLMQQPVTVGKEITMCLMKREKGSLFPMPASRKDSLKSACSINDDEELTGFQKLLLAKMDDVFDIIQREREELQELLLQDEEAPEVCFIESAMKFLQDRENGLSHRQQEKRNNSAVGHIPEESIFHEDQQLNNKCSSENSHILDIVTNGRNPANLNDGKISPLFDEENDLIQAFENLETNSVTPSVLESPDSKLKGKDCYFYQADDGQHIYLHNLNVRMMLKEYGSLENCPSIIKGEVVELERISMTETLRKRLRYLQHLPLTCEFQLAELNISSILSKSTVDEFSVEVQKRKRLRNKKARDERKREKYIELEENKKLGKYPSATYNLNSATHFPVCDTTNELQFSSFTMPAEASLEDDSRDLMETTSSNCSINSPDLAASPVTSFAQMLKDGQAKPHQYHVHETKSALPVSVHSRESDEDDKYMPVPEYRQSFSDALQIALEAARHQKEHPEEKTSKKKKKAKNKLLFTTSMCRNK